MLCYFLCSIKAGIVHIGIYVHTFVRVIIFTFLKNKLEKMVTYKALGEPSDQDLSEHFPKSFLTT